MVGERALLQFLEDRTDWLLGAIERQLKHIIVGECTGLPVEGRLRTIITAPGARMSISRDVITVRGPEERAGAQVSALLKARARERAIEALDDYSNRLGRPYTRLTLRDTKGRWGSCTHDGGIMLSWRLIMAPPPVLRYVAAHEVAHLAHLDHSSGFWAVVEDLYPGWQSQRDWLKTEGASLHRYRF